MIYTVRYAHLQNQPDLSIGSIVKHGDVIGVMGNTGQSVGAHLHIDLIEGAHPLLYRLSDIGYSIVDSKKYSANLRELNYFIDKDLFQFPYEITTYFGDPRYNEKFNKDHPAYDVVPTDRHTSDNHKTIYWNRSFTGYVINKGFDKNGYGNYIQIKFNK